MEWIMKWFFCMIGLVAMGLWDMIYALDGFYS